MLKLMQLVPGWERLIKVLTANQTGRSSRRTVRDRRDEAYHRLPRWMQPAISMISAIPPSNSSPTFIWTKPAILACIAAWVVAGLVLGAVGAGLILDSNPMGLLLCPIGWLLATGGFRATMTTALHDCVHQLERHCKKNAAAVHKYFLGWWGELITILLLLPDLANYYAEHVLKHHKSDVFCTLKDPDARLLHKLGYRAGMTKPELWKRFWRLLFNPCSRLYAIYSWSRWLALVSNRRRLYLVVLVWSPILLGLAATGNLLVFLMAFVVPAVFGIPAAAMCQFLSEHGWLLVRKEEDRRQYLARTCRGRLFLDECPDPNLPTICRYRAWFFWGMRLVFVQLPLRVAICPFDLAAGHDLHHFGESALCGRNECPKWTNWMNAGHFRRWVEIHCPEYPLTTYFNLFQAIDSVFEIYSTLDPSDPSLHETDDSEGENTVWNM